MAFVPLGTPLLAGPGAIAATMLYIEKADTAPAVLTVAVAIAVQLIAGALQHWMRWGVS